MQISNECRDRLMACLDELGRSVTDITPMVGDASLRQYVRILEKEGTSVAMIMPPGASSMAEERESSHAEGKPDLPFLTAQQFLSEAGQRVPKIYAYDAERAILLMEDLGDISLFGHIHGQWTNHNHMLVAYRKAIDLLVAFENLTQTPALPAYFKRAFDRETLIWEFEHFNEWALERGLDTRLSDSEKQTFQEVFSTLVDGFTQLPFVLVHRDFHSRNIMLPDGNLDQATLIDFQDMLMGPALYDLASLLKDSYVALPDELQDELFDDYFDKSHLSSSMFKTVEHARTAFLKISLHRNMKAAGRFAYFAFKNGNTSFLPDIPRTIDSITGSLSRLQGLDNLKTILSPYLPRIKERFS